ADLAVAPAGGAPGGRSAFGRAIAMTYLASLKARNPYFGLKPRSRLFERDLDIVPEIRAAPRPCAPASARAEYIAEPKYIADYIFETREALTKSRPGARAHARMTEPVVTRSKLGLG